MAICINIRGEAPPPTHAPAPLLLLSILEPFVDYVEWGYPAQNHAASDYSLYIHKTNIK